MGDATVEKIGGYIVSIQHTALMISVIISCVVT